MPWLAMCKVKAVVLAGLELSKVHVQRLDLEAGWIDDVAGQPLDQHVEAALAIGKLTGLPRDGREVARGRCRRGTIRDSRP